jgi:hypothetical protein
MTLPTCLRLVCVLILCGVTGATKAESVILTPPRKVGESINIEMTITRERNDVGRPPSKNFGTTPVRVHILDTADKQTVVGWTLGKPRVNAPQDITKELDPLTDLFAGQTIELVFDEHFSAHSIRNLDQMIQLSKRTLAAIEKTLPKEQSAIVIPRVRQMFADPNTVQSVMMQKPGTYFLVYGWELDPGDPRQEEMSLPNPFGGDPLSATVTIELQPHQPADTHYIVHYKQDLDPAGVERTLRATMQRIQGDKYSPDMALPKFNIQDNGEYKINKANGWVEHAAFKRTKTYDNGSQTDAYEFHHVK